MKDIFSYRCHQQFAEDFIKSTGLGYRPFLKQYNVELSLTTLCGLLAKNHKNEFKRGVSDENYLIFLDSTKLNNKKKEYLLLLKKANEAQKEYPKGHLALSTYKNAVTRSRSLSKRKANYSKESLRVAESYDKLSVLYKKDVIVSVLSVLDLCREGQPDYFIENNLVEVREKLKNLLS